MRKAAAKVAELAGTFTKITTEEAAKYLGMDESEMTRETCSKQYKIAWDATHQLDPINTTMTTALEEEIAQLQTDSKELMSRVAAMEESVADNNGTGGEVAKSPRLLPYGMIMVSLRI
jgi:hypothetical protein